MSSFENLSTSLTFDPSAQYLTIEEDSIGKSEKKSETKLSEIFECVFFNIANFNPDQHCTTATYCDRLLEDLHAIKEKTHFYYTRYTSKVPLRPVTRRLLKNVHSTEEAYENARAIVDQWYMTIQQKKDRLEILELLQSTFSDASIKNKGLYAKHFGIFHIALQTASEDKKWLEDNKELLKKIIRIFFIKARKGCFTNEQGMTFLEFMDKIEPSLEPEFIKEIELLNA